MNQRSKDPKLPPHAHKKELTKGKGGGRWRERERGGGGGEGERKKKEPKRKRERKKTSLQPDKSRDCRIFRQGCYSYFMVQSEQKYWSTKS